MDATTKSWLRSAKKWVEEMELVVKSNNLESALLKKQVSIMQRRVRLMEQQNDSYKKSMKFTKKRISSLTKRRK